jgi:hypothetical protein
VNPTPNIEAQLEELRPIYDAVQALLARRCELRTVEQAQAAFDSLLVTESEALATLIRRREAVRSELLRQTIRPTSHEALAPPPPVARAAPKPRVATPVNPTPFAVKAPAGAKQRFKRMVNRWSFVWGLDEGLLARINAIVDNDEHLAGEALALLPWEVFVTPTSKQEGGTAHAARILEWADALVEYRARLEGEVQRLEVRYRGLLGIWELWRRRESDLEGNARWQAFVEDKRQALVEEADGVQRMIAELESQTSRGVDRP